MSALLAAARPTYRDMLAHRWRSLAGVALVALPVAVLVCLGILGVNGDRFHNVFSSNPRTIGVAASEDTKAVHLEPAAGFASRAEEILPGDLRPSPIFGPVTVGVQHDSKHSNIQITQFDSALPPTKAQPLIDSAHPDEGTLILSYADARSLGVHKGDVVSISSPTPGGLSEAKVAGIIPGGRSYATAPVLTNTEFLAQHPEQATWAIVGDTVLNQNDIARVQSAGFSIYDKSLSEATIIDSGVHLNFEAFLSFIAIASSFAFAVTLLLALIAPVFSFALRRNTRMYALMAAQGAQPKHIATAVLAYGFFTGLLGATSGAVLGLAGSYAIGALRFPGVKLDVPLLYPLALWAIAIVASTAAALVPAWLAARQALAPSLHGGMPDRILNWRKEMAYGPVALPVILIALLTPFGKSIYSLLILLAFLATAASVPALVYATARVCSHHGLALRIASRDLMRRGFHTVPTAIALIAVTLAAAAGSVGVRSDEAWWDKVDTVVNPSTSAIVRSTDYQKNLGAPANKVEQRAIDSALALQPGKPLETFGYTDWNSTSIPGSSIPNIALEMEYDYTCEQTSYNDSVEQATFIDKDGRRTDESGEARQNCLHDMMTWFPSSAFTRYGRTLEATPETLDLWNFDSDADRQAAADTLRKGGVVLTHNSHLDGRDHAEFTAVRTPQGQTEPREEVSATLPAVEALPALGRDLRLVSPAAAKKLKISSSRIGTAIVFDKTLERSQQKEIEEAVENATGGEYEISFTKTTSKAKEYAPAIALWGIGFILLVLIIANSAAALRRSGKLFESLGAEPSLMPKVAAWRTWLVGTIGMTLGFIVGEIIGIIMIRVPRPGRPEANELFYQGDLYSMDWWQLAGVFIVPLLGAGGSWLVHRRLSAVEAEQND
ncbi:hypothetical protein HMPREF3169_06160 [Corynebacterium sp. HMSC08C04]|uniref:ABC transporter permease n=1 Tax=unclassified Corynebacterium TaxID=2624378 RepID=UPI0008A2F334|nr:MULTISPECIES: FtsX-like permease family protein [unclassified Corynebacterium]OFT34327.1 hypothetical protein HMPREF3169_06160 [Corynebacterium sp. HMSC08C04]OFT49065.1 hypothetical protein HMPREF3158_00990 [Corynebacterium sp. HMSC06G04]